jgi:hypothetical protein
MYFEYNAEWQWIHWLSEGEISVKNEHTKQISDLKSKYEKKIERQLEQQLTQSVNKIEEQTLLKF